MGISNKVIAVVVTYNRKALLVECIDSLLAQKSDALLDILIIDNASTDGTKQTIQQLIDEKSIYYILDLMHY